MCLSYCDESLIYHKRERFTITTDHTYIWKWWNELTKLFYFPQTINALMNIFTNKEHAFKTSVEDLIRT